MGITYRKAEKKDAEILAQFMEDLVEAKGDAKAVARQIEKMAEQEQYYLCLACEEEQVLGTAMGILCEDICEKCQRFLVIENVYVAKEHRGKKVATGILEELEAWAKEHNSYYAILVSENRREAAHKFYQESGYKKMGGFKKLF